MKCNKENVKHVFHNSQLSNLIDNIQKDRIISLLSEDRVFNIAEEFTQKHVCISLSEHILSDFHLSTNELVVTGIYDVDLYNYKFSIIMKVPINYFYNHDENDFNRSSLCKNILHIGFVFKSKNDDSKDATFDVFPDSMADNNSYTYSFSQSVILEIKAQKEGLSPYSSKISSVVSEDKFSKTMMEIDPTYYIKYIYPLIRTIQSEC